MPRSIVPTLRGLITVASILLCAAVTDAQETDPKPKSERETWVNQDERKLNKYEIGRSKLAIEGYDPVAYFKEGGGKPAKGKKNLEHTHRGIVYRFANAKNLELFKSNPDHYEPTHGGWCAYAMAKGDYTEPNPKRFLIQNGRLMLFYDGLFGDTYKLWLEEGPDALEKKADEFWMTESGEKPRIPEKDETNETENESPSAKGG